MTKDELEVRLHHIADAVKVLYENKKLSDTMQTCACGLDCQIYTGIFEMCDLLGVKPEREFFGKSIDCIRIFFNFEGVKFFELCEVKNPVTIDDMELRLKEGEVLSLEPQGIFKDMQKVVDDFDKATGNLHADLGTLGVVE